jgi:NAD(P)H-nitrite reductase large subunit
VPFTPENLREIIQSQRLKSVQQVLAIYGNGEGCEIWPPSATLWT